MSDLNLHHRFFRTGYTGIISDDEGYKDGQCGKNMLIYEKQMPDLSDTDIIIVGCPEYRGKQAGKKPSKRS